METTEFVTLAILAKQKAHLLPLYLEQIEKQTYPASKIKLYIRTNNNKDQTTEILQQWIEKVKDRYDDIYFDSSDIVENVQDYAPHEWNNLRLKVIGRLRQESVQWAKERGTHYFVCDCDNFIIPETLTELMKTNLPVVAPLLRNADDRTSMYANFHFAIDDNGYYAPAESYARVLYNVVCGLIKVPVVHCTYLIRNEYLKDVCYDDESGRFEYVIFSDTLRKADVTQYIDNRREYGQLTFAETEEVFKSKNIII